ncbi:MAG: aminomethyl-transferring glycine dehydrogenase subunit GcvPA [Acidobacteria bacterium]|nr:aminomethyl-transferring glycine dehydrogenase subunit GcvPA [Acidobacteriota bacterium]
MKYLPLSPKDKSEMLEFIGVSNIDDLFTSIPKSLRFDDALHVPKAKSEMEIRAHFEELAQQNTSFRARFMGGGAYAHFWPVVVDTLSQRQEFLTSYTPYQPEISQGTLQYLFEFQTMMCVLTGLDVSNASMYDGATATAEAVLMASRLKRKRSRVLVSEGVHPYYRQVVATYLSNLDLTLETIPCLGHLTDLNALETSLGNDVCAVVVGYPNFFGAVEPLQKIAEMTRAQGAMTAAVTMEALSLALLKSPGSQGADLSVGEAQSFGNPTNFGGPHLGFFTCRDDDKRQMPGRICGQTVDRNGVRAYVLTLNAREQHIRRAKATSNICSNEGLCALRATIYLTAMGKYGLRELAVQNHAKAMFLKRQLGNINGIFVTEDPIFNEFTIKLDRPASAVLDALEKRGIQGGVDLGRFDSTRDNEMLIAVTELNTRAQLDAYCQAMEAVL